MEFLAHCQVSFINLVITSTKIKYLTIQSTKPCQNEMLIFFIFA